MFHNIKGAEHAFRMAKPICDPMQGFVQFMTPSLTIRIGNGSRIMFLSAESWRGRGYRFQYTDIDDAVYRVNPKLTELALAEFAMAKDPLPQPT